MSVDQHVYHILTVTGFSENSFDEAAKNAVQGGWENHHDEFEAFVSYEVIRMHGPIEMVEEKPRVGYAATVAISAIHRPHAH
jgi:flavin-binding protein dodecin